MSKGEELVLTDRNVWNVYSPNPPIINWITDSKISIITRRITASDTSEKFKYIGIDMFMGYGPYNSSPFLPYESVSIMGYWNDFAGMNKYLDQSNPGDWVEFVIDFRYLNDHHGGDFVLDYNRKPISCPYGIPGVQGGTRMNYNDLYKIFKVTGAIYFRVWHRTRWACESESAKVTDAGYIYSGYVDNFQHPTVGHTFEGGVCIYPYRPLVYVLYDKANENMSLKVYAPMTFRQHGEKGYWEKPDYVPNNNTKWDIAITASIVGEGSPNPGMSGQYGPGEHEIFRRVFTKSNNDRWVNTTFNKRLDEVFPNRRGKTIAFRVWYNANINGWGWTGWETTGPDPTNMFHQCLLAEEKCFPTMYYNQLPVPRGEQGCTVRAGTIAQNYDFRAICSDPDKDWYFYSANLYLKKSGFEKLTERYVYCEISNGDTYNYLKSNSVINIVNLLKLSKNEAYGTHPELYMYAQDRFFSKNSGTGQGETISSPTQTGHLVCPYTIDFYPENISISFNRTVGDEFTATINGSHPDWGNCKFYLSAKDEDDKWERPIKGSWGSGNWEGFLNSWQKGNVITFNLASLFGEPYRGKRFKFYVAVISPHGWDKHLGWTDLRVRLNDRPRVDLGLEKTLGPTVFGEVLAADQDGVKTINVEFCLANGNNQADTSKLWRRSYTIHGEPYINIIEEITPKLSQYGISSSSYIGKKVFVRAGAVDSLGCERAPSDMAWKEMVYDTPPDVSFYLENTKGEEAFMIIKTTYPNGLPRLSVIAECPNKVEKFVYNNFDVTSHQKEIRLRFSPPEHGFKDADRMKQFKFRAELTNAMGQAMVFRTANWTWNDIPTVAIENVEYGPLNNGLIRTGCGTMKPIFTYRTNDSDNVRITGEIGDNGENNNLKTVLSDNASAGTVIKKCTIDLKQYFKNYGVEFNYKTFRVHATDIFNKSSNKAASRVFRMLDGHRISGINIEPASLSTNVENTVSGKNFNVRVKFYDTPYARTNINKSVLDVQLYRKNDSRYRVLYIVVNGSVAPYKDYLTNTTLTFLDKKNDRNYINTLNYDNLKNSYDLVIIDANYASLTRNEVQKAKELADKGMPCYIIGNDTSEEIFANGITRIDNRSDTKWHSGLINSELPFTNTISGSVTLSQDTKTFYNNLNDSVFPIVISNGKHAIFCYNSNIVSNTKAPYTKSSYVIQDNDYNLRRDMFIRLVDFLVSTKKDFHTLISHQSYDITAFDSGHVCKPSDIVKTFDGASLSLQPNQKVFAKARVRTFVDSNGWDGDYFYYFEDSNKYFSYAPEPSKPSVLYPVSSSSTPLCLKNPPIVISTGSQPNPANSQINDIRVKWNGQYYYASTQTQNFSNTADNYNNTTIVFYPPSLLNAGTNRIEINVKSKLTNIWSATTIHDIYIKNVSVVKTQGEIVSAYIPPRDLINELRRAYGMSNYSFPGTSSGVSITYENHINVLNKSFNELVDRINGYCVKKNWCTHMNVGNQMFILASSTPIINNFLTKFNK